MSEIKTLADLEDALSRPSARDIAFMRRWPGDVMILGASGKMGPSLARLCRRAATAANDSRRVIAVSPNPWAINTIVPSLVADRFRESRIVVFSTGNVYPLRDAASGGSREADPPAPLGEYAQSCLGRERVFEHFSHRHGLLCVLFRLNYAVDLRYGVLVDIARKVYAGAPVSFIVPAFNVIWQRDANSYALRSLEYCDAPPRILNITGREMCSVRATGEFFAARFGRPCRFEGVEGRYAL